MTTSVTKLGVLALLALAGLQAQAQTTVYKCVENGRVLYTDTASQPNCKAIDTQGAISAPPRAPAPAVTMRQGAARAPAATAPSNFPRVDNATQRARDDDRRAILQDELRSEEKKLAELKQVFNNGEPERQGNEKNYAKYQERVVQMRDDIGRSEKNIEALKRELAAVAEEDDGGLEHFQVHGEALQALLRRAEVGACMAKDGVAAPGKIAHGDFFLAQGEIQPGLKGAVVVLALQHGVAEEDEAVAVFELKGGGLRRGVGDCGGGGGRDVRLRRRLSGCKGGAHKRHEAGQGFQIHAGAIGAEAAGVV